MSNEVLWQYVFQVVMCVLGAVQCALPSTQYTHHNLKRILPQHFITHNDVFLLINSTKV